MARTSLAAIAIATAFPALAQTASNNPTPLPPSARPTDPQDAAEEDRKPGDIVVTGTLIRGTTPAGSTLITATAPQIQAQGAANGNEVLANIPQAANMFQALSSGAGLGLSSVNNGVAAANRIPVQQVTLRNLPNANQGASPTLILIDGHRVVPVGTSVVGGQAVDSVSISAATMERVEVMPDGGSAIYGSDAVAGTINYITRDSFDGVELRARGGLAGSYRQVDAGITAGAKWSSGSIYASSGYAAHDALLGRDRDYIGTFDRNSNSPLYNQSMGLNCHAPNISITSNVGTPPISSRRLYPMTGPGGTILGYTTNGGTNGNGVGTNGRDATPNGNAGGNRCDSATDYVSWYPEQRTFNANFGLKQDVTDSLSFMLKGSWSDRRTKTFVPLTLTATPIAPPNGNSTRNVYIPVCNAVQTPQPAGPICGVTPGYFAGDHALTQTIFTDFSSTLLGNNTNSFVNISTWQVTPSFSWDFAKDWQLRGLLSYGQSKSTGIQGSLNGALVNQRIFNARNPANPTANLPRINPYNLPASDPGALDGLLSFTGLIGEFHILDARVIADGPLPFFELPAGPIRAAVGAEYTKTDLFHSTSTATIPNSTVARIFTTPDDITYDPALKYTQTVKSVFGEVQIPLVDEDMNIPLISALDLSASGRYDKYNDFGDTFNPLLGATWAVVPWFKIRGNYGTSFAAPNHLTQLAAATGAQLNGVRTNANGQLAYFDGGNQGIQQTPGGVLTIQPLLNSGTVKPGADDPDGIGPQRSTSWSIGFDASPPFVPGLSFGLSYYYLKISDLIAPPGGVTQLTTNKDLTYCSNGVNGDAPNAATACLTPFSSAELASRGFTVAADPNNIFSPGLATASSLVLSGTQGAASGTNAFSWQQVLANYCEPTVFMSGAGNGVACPANSYTVMQVLDNRSRNLGLVYATGLDFNVNYFTNVPWGTLDARVAGTVNLSTEQQPNPKVDTKADYLATGVSAFRLSSSLGTTWGGLRAQLTWQHSHGYDIPATDQGPEGTATVPGSRSYGATRVGSFNTFDLFFRYRFDDEQNALLKGLDVTFNLNNVFDTSPPIYGTGYANGSTLGRMFLLGVTKAFK